MKPFLLFLLPTLALSALVTAPARLASAQVPQTMSYQGVLTDNAGNLVPDGTYDLTFRLFDVSVAGVALYTEAHPAVLVTRGGFSVLIGEISPLTLPFDEQYWLEIQVNADPPLVPRVKLASSPYALSLRLPFVGSTGVAAPGAGIAITNTGTGRALEGTAGSGIGVRGTSVSGVGVLAVTGSGFGVQAAAGTGSAVFAQSDGGIGVDARSLTSKAIYGQTNSTAFAAIAIHGVVSSTSPGGSSAAVRGQNNGTGGNGIGVYGSHDGTGTGVYGFSPGGEGVTGNTGTGIGVYAQATSGNAVVGSSMTGTGVIGQTPSTAANAIGVHGIILSAIPGGFSAAVRGENRGTLGSGIGVWGSQNGTGWGVYGSGGSLAGNFAGNVNVSGTLTKTSGAFKIDHPLDPENKYLYHSFVESPDMKNIYDGTAILDANGEVTVRLPDWFEALNRDFRYQLTAIGAPAPGLHVAEKLEGCRFTIAGGPPGLEVSWQVTGTRHDASANAHRIPNEVEKAVADRGLYVDPAAFGQPREKGISYAQERRMSGGDKAKAAVVPASGAGSTNSKQGAGAPVRARAGR